MVPGGPGAPQSADRSPHLSRDKAAAILNEAREAVWAQAFPLADRAVRRLQHRHSQAFLPFADVRIARTDTHDTHNAADSADSFRRSLDLRTATHRAHRRDVGDHGYDDVHTEAFASHPDNVVSYIRRSSSPQTLSMTLTSPLLVLDTHVSVDDGRLRLFLRLPSDVAPPHDASPSPVEYDDRPGAASRGAVVVAVETDGTLTVEDPSECRCVVHDCTVLRCLLTTETTFQGLGRPLQGDAARCGTVCEERLDAALGRPQEELYQRHLNDYQPLYRRTVLCLGRADTPAGNAPFDEEPSGDAGASDTPKDGPRAADDTATDERLAAVEAADASPGATDPALVALLFHYGRYLLISASRSGGVPANLQGIWNDSLQPPWSSNYTTNINLEMNYWMVEPANLRECVGPLFDLVTTLSRTGRRPAAELYGCEGWVAHHNSDIWGYPWPVGNTTHDPKWAFWPMAGLWLLHHLWDHYRFGASDRFVRETMWPVLRGAAQFAVAWPVDAPDGTLATAPSTSPEKSVPRRQWVARLLRRIFHDGHHASSQHPDDGGGACARGESRGRSCRGGGSTRTGTTPGNTDHVGRTGRRVAPGLHRGGTGPSPPFSPLFGLSRKRPTLPGAGRGGGGITAWPRGRVDRLVLGVETCVVGTLATRRSRGRHPRVGVPPRGSTLRDAFPGGLYDNLFGSHPPFPNGRKLRIHRGDVRGSSAIASRSDRTPSRPAPLTPHG